LLPRQRHQRDRRGAPGRRCAGIEIDPAYVDTIIRRWEAHCGERARHAGMGRTFRELEIEREIADIQ